MRKFLLFTLTYLLISSASFGQDFTNKGKDFWVGYGYHQVMVGGNGQDMVLYFATDQITTITVSIPGLGYSVTYPNIAANTVFTTPPMPKTGATDARLLVDGLSNKGIHVVASKPIVSYAHIYNSSVSGACVMLPTNTLGKEYYSINYKNVSNSNNANSWFYVVATEPGTTAVEITPSAATLNTGWITGNTYTVNLTQGQIYNVMGGLLATTGTNPNLVYNAVDLTGSKIKSISTGAEGCKKIAVYSGSGRISITCTTPTTSSSSDNYMVQAFPKTAWGRKFLTATTGVPITNPVTNITNVSMTNNIYRICVSHPAAVVKINNIITTLPLQNGFYYEVPATNIPLKIESDSTITVAQYVTSQSACSNNTPGDPEVIYLSPVEQNIKKVLFNSNLLVAGTPKHFVNAIIPNGGTALSSFRIDGAVPNDLFVTHPQDPNFSYIKIDSLALGAHTLVSDSGFNAIAYGFASAESYGYNAGTNVLDLIQSNSLVTQYGSGGSPTACTGAPFKFRISLGFKPLKLTWNLNVIPGMLPNNNNVVQNPNPSCTLLSPADAAIYVCPDSITIVNGKEKFWYSLPTFYTINTIATYPINIDVLTSNTDGCGTNQDIDFDLEVSAPPVANFTYNQPNCFAETIQFNDASSTTLNYKWYWTFGEPSSGNADTSYSQNPTHTYAGPGTYTVRFASITTPGCLSDTISKPVIVPAFPTGTISGSTSVCLNAPAPTITFAGALGATPYEFTYNVNGGPNQTIQTTGTSNTVTLNPPTNAVGTFTYNLTKIRCVNSTLCFTSIMNQSAVITINPLPTATISGTNVVCKGSPAQTITFTGANGTAPYTFTYTFNGGANQTITTTTGNSATITVPTTTVGSFAYALVSVKDGLPTACTNPAVGSATISVQQTSTATIAGATAVCQDAPAPIILLIGSTGITPLTFTYNINGGATQSVTTLFLATTESIIVPMSATGTFTYNLLSVENNESISCITPITGQSATVVINPNPTATISGTNTVCQTVGTQNITFTGAGGTAPYTFTYKINGGANQTVTTTTGNSVTVPISTNIIGTFVYTLTQVKDASVGTLCTRAYTTGNTATFQVQATSTATITGSTNVCQDATAPIITFTAANGVAPFTFEYNINGGATQTLATTATSFSATLTVPMTTTGPFVYNLLSVKNTGPILCQTAITGASVTVNINPVPTATIMGSTTVCQVAGAQTVTLTGSGGTAPYTFTYSINGVTQPTVVSTGNIATLTAPVTTVGTFVYKIISVRDASSTLCINTFAVALQPTATVVVQATSTATIATSVAAVCQDGAAPIITFTAANGTPPFTFTYNIDGGATQTITTAAASNSVTLPVPMVTAGTFVYNLLSVKNTGTINCTTPITGTSTTVVINPIPAATISLAGAAATTVCQNAAQPVVTFGASGGTAPYTINYTLNGVAQAPIIVTGVSTTINAPTNVVNVLNYVITSVKDATSTQCLKTYTIGAPTAVVTIKQLATAVLAGTTTVCQASTAPNITFTAAGGVAPYTFNYTLNGTPLSVTTATGNSVTVPVSTTTAGTYTYNLVSVQESSTVACVNNQTGTATVIVHPKPTASYAVAAPYCALKDISFTPTFGITPTGSVTSWVWNYGDGTGVQVRPNGLPFIVNYATAGVKPVSFKVISDKGCESDLAVTPPVVIQVKPKAGFLSPESCLADAFAQFTDSSKPAGTIALWEWNFGDPLSATNIISGSGPTFQNPQHAYATTGLKTVSLIVTTMSGCKDTVQAQSFFINGEVTSADFTTQTPVICSNRPVQIKENSVVNVGGLIRVEIYWDNVAAPTVVETDELPFFGKIYTHSYPNLQVDRTYQVRYIAYTGFDGTCQKEVTKDIIVRASPVATFITPQDVCLNGGPVVLNTGTATGGTAVYTGPGVTVSAGVYTFNPLAAGVVVGTSNNVTYTVTSPANCDSVLVRQVKVLAPPVVNTFTTVGNICVGGPGGVNSVTFNQNSTVSTGGGGAIVKWIYDWGDGNPPQTFTSGANVTHVYTTTGPKTAHLIVEDAYGCRNAAPGKPLTFTVNPLPVPSYVIATPSVCLPNATVGFTNTTANLAANTYNWSFELPSTAAGNVSSLTSPSHIYTTQGPYSTQLVATVIATGCKDSTAVLVINSTTIHPAPVVAFAPMADICLNGGTRQLTQGSETSGIAGTGVYSGLGVSPTGLFNPLTAGVGPINITYTFTSTFNCVTSIQKIIKVLAPPVVNTFTTVGNTCVGGPGGVNSVTFNQTSAVTTGAGGAIVKWIYDWGDGTAVQTFTSGANVTHVYTTTGPKTAYLIVEDAYGCRNAAPGKSLTFTVNPLPVPSYLIATPSVCLPNATVGFTNTTANLAANSYNWSFELPSTAAGNVSTNTNPTHIYTTQGPYSTQLVATVIATGCKDSTAILVINSTTIHPAPVVAFAPMADICLNNGTRLLTQGSETSGIAGTGVYSGPGVTATGLFNPLLAGGPGVKTITYTFTSTFNCSTSITGTIKVLVPPVVNTFTTVGNKCERNDITFANTTTSTEGVVAQWIYNWGDASALQTATTGANIIHNYALANTYNATLSLVTDYGCNSTPPAFSLNVIVNPLPRPNFTYSDTACLPVASVLFKNTTPSIGNWIYNWNFDVPSTAIIDNSTSVSNITHLYYTQAPHNVRLIALSVTTGCTDSIFKPITTIHPAPFANFDFNKPSACIGDNVCVIDRSTYADGTPKLWNWDWNDGSISTTAGPCHTFATTSDNHSIKLIVTNSFGCVDDTTRQFAVYEYPTANAGRDSIILQGGNLTLTPIVTGRNLTYFWSGNPAPENLSSKVVKNPVASPVEDITYKLVLTGIGGCVAPADFVFIKVLKDPVVPNTFTPNNDGNHDTWVIKYLESYPDNRVQIFTRAGQLVFESKRYLQPWNGTMNGKSLPIDTYYYIIEPGSGRKSITGFVTIIK